MNLSLARRRRTNFVLMMVSLVFFLAWAPINIYLLALDSIVPYQVLPGVPSPNIMARPILIKSILFSNFF